MSEFDQIEDQAKQLLIGNNIASALALSSAISLKRIADALTYQSEGGPNLFDLLDDMRDHRQ